MTDDRQKKLAADSFKRGNEAMMRQNWDYSCEMFRQCVNLVPENLLFRQSLRGVAEKKHRDNATGAAMNEQRLRTIKAAIGAARGREEWDKIDQFCEDGLALNPWDAVLNVASAEAAFHLGYLEIAMYSLQRVKLTELSDLESLRQLGHLYVTFNMIPEAIACYTKIARLDPLAGDARAMVIRLKSEYDDPDAGAGMLVPR